MKNIRLLLFTVVAGIGMSSCIYETLYNTWHPGHSQLTVATNWTNTNAAEVPYTIKLTDSQRNTTDHPGSGLVNLLPLQNPDTYAISILSNERHNVEVAATGSISPAIINGYISTDFDYVFTGDLSGVVLEADKDQSVDVVMKQHAGLLKFEIALENDPFIATADGRNPHKRVITKQTATVSGIARTYNYKTNRYDETPGTINLPITVVPDSQDNRTLRCEVRILGTVGYVQNLNVTLEFEHGEPYVMPEKNIYDLLAGFNSQKNVVKNAKTALTMPDLASGDTEITEWEPVEPEDIELNDDILNDYVYKVGDYYPVNDRANAWGIVIKVDETGKIGTILGMAKGTGWAWAEQLGVGEEDVLVQIGANSDSGKENTQIVFDYIDNNTDGLTLDYFPAFSWLKRTYGSSTSWYIPTGAEAEELLKNFDAENETSLSDLLSAAGQGATSMNGFFVSSKESDAENAYFWNLQLGIFDQVYDKLYFTNLGVRAFYDFGN